MRTSITGFFLLFYSALIGQNYRSECQLRDNYAYGYIDNLGDAFTLNGNLLFAFYDCEGNLLSVQSENEYELVGRQEREEIEHTTAPANACKCDFLPSEAITGTKLSPQKSLLTTCKLEGSYAKGYLHNLGDAINLDGKAWFYFYDCEGNLLSSEDEYEAEYVSARSTEEIEYTFAPSNACGCSFDISEMTDLLPDAPSSHLYQTECRLKNGQALGYLHNFRDALTLEGEVFFYFYDCNGQVLKKERAHEYEYVSAKTSEEISHVNAPTNACNCNFEVSNAVK